MILLFSTKLKISLVQLTIVSRGMKYILSSEQKWRVLREKRKSRVARFQSFKMCENLFWTSTNTLLWTSNLLSDSLSTDESYIYKVYMGMPPIASARLQRWAIILSACRSHGERITKCFNLRFSNSRHKHAKWIFLILLRIVLV